jgi:hypothetical protein
MIVTILFIVEATAAKKSIIIDGRRSRPDEETGAQHLRNPNLWIRWKSSSEGFFVLFVLARFRNWAISFYTIKQAV